MYLRKFLSTIEKTLRLTTIRIPANYCTIIKTRTNRNSNCCTAPQTCRRSESLYLMLFCHKYSSGTQESNSAYNLCWNSCRVGRRINRTYIFVSYCCKSRTQTDKRIRTKSCRSLLPFPLNTKKCTKNQCQNKTHKYRHAIKFI